ncbi:MAG TPA: AAC(3)-I family aminoglycoside 3-N-acetyltransferase [Cytophagales bacterium]|nr:AAC(3)-I family aminoglycoside 3-N-acetyltransferase [Cytophagales bacterium]HAA21335.1 AAC(3)-I family aminoglycoside 3-N-acetyltransferase [Cytophagales bacterium]HAP64161.1 AAC(3)-I family aminoglycoside 3-N-acetyltransferase [Cytophagales bacterium]
MKSLIVRLLTPDELPQFEALVRLFEVVFEMENFQIPPKDHLQQVLEKPGFFVMVAIQEGTVVGGLTAYTLDQYYSQKPLAYIYDLAVDTTLQRQGIGKQLIAAFHRHCQERGYEEVFVQADEVDDYALDFYRSTRPTEEEKVRHFYYSL